jgi:hypothetical protein
MSQVRMRQAKYRWGKLKIDEASSVDMSQVEMR